MHSLWFIFAANNPYKLELTWLNHVGGHSELVGVRKCEFLVPDGVRRTSMTEQPVEHPVDHALLIELVWTMDIIQL